jgi:hypothetical protein
VRKTDNFSAICESFDVSQPNMPPQPVTEIASLFFLREITAKEKFSRIVLLAVLNLKKKYYFFCDFPQSLHTKIA